MADYENKDAVVPQVANDADDLSKTVDRILKATNPNVGGTRGEHKEHYFSHKKEERCFKPVPTMDQTAFHLVVNGNAIGVNDPEAIRQQAEHTAKLKALKLAEEAEKNPELVEEAGNCTKILKNQFNFTDRASQTFNNPLRHRYIMTEPPPIITFSSTASQWEIYDAYKDEAEQQKAGKGGKTKSGKDDKKRDVNGGEQNEDILNSQQMLLSLKIMERMVNQNSCHDITDDYKYWDDMGDPYKPDSGTLLPLWKFNSEMAKKKTVTSICWNPKYNDLFAVGYGSYEFLKQGTGMIHCWSLKNWSYPEFTFSTESGVMCIDFHKQHSSVCQRTLRLLSPTLLPSTPHSSSPAASTTAPCRSSTYGSTPTSPSTFPPSRPGSIWTQCGRYAPLPLPSYLYPLQVYWSREEGKNLSFYSVSSDGRVTQWILSKNELQHNDVTELKITEGLGGDREDLDASLAGLSGGTCFDFQVCSITSSLCSINVTSTYKRIQYYAQRLHHFPHGRGPDCG